MSSGFVKRKLKTVDTVDNVEKPAEIQKKQSFQKAVYFVNKYFLQGKKPV